MPRAKRQPRTVEETPTPTLVIADTEAEAEPAPAYDPFHDVVVDEPLRIAARAFDEAEFHADDLYQILEDARKAGRPKDVLDRIESKWESAAYLAENCSEALSYTIQTEAGERLKRLNHCGYDWTPRAAIVGKRLYVSWIGETENCGRPGLLAIDMKGVIQVEEG